MNKRDNKKATSEDISGGILASTLSVSWASDFLAIKKHPSNCSVLQVSFISGYTSLGLTSITSINLAKHVLQLGLIALDAETRKIIQDGNIPVAKNSIQTISYYD